MKKAFLFITISVLSLALCSFTNITDEDLRSSGYDEEVIEQLKQDFVYGKDGIVSLPECHAQIAVPDGFMFLDKEQAKRLLVDYWNNPTDRITDLLGVLIPNNADCYYQVSVAYVVTYSNCGYIKDDDANSVDYDELLSQMKEAVIEENKSLPQEQQMLLEGWAIQPKYIALKNTLIWARSFSANGEIVINYDIRILGKDGLVSVNAVIGQEDMAEVQSKEDIVINSVQYLNGYRYSDFDSTRDKVSDWTIGGLVAGGILAKTGILSKIGIFLLKFSKIIIVGLVALFGGLFRFFKRNKEE